MKAHDHSDLNVKKIDHLSSTRVRLTLEFSVDSVKEHESQMVNNYSRQAKIPGFRPGKAPANIVRQKYKEDIEKDVISHLLEAGLHEALTRTKLTPVNRPNISFGEGNTPPSLDKALEFSAEFEVQPEIKLKDYTKIPLKKFSTEVTEEEIKKGIDDLRERFAALEPSDAKKPAKGMYAIAEVGYEIPGTDKKEAPRSLTIELGAGNVIDEIEAALLKMSVGEDTKVKAKFPDTHTDPAVAGKEAEFSIKLLELKAKKLPELTDEWAQQLRPDSTVEKLREEMKKAITSNKEEDGRRQYKDAIIEHLVKKHTFEVSPSLVEQQSYRLLQSVLEDYKRQGLTPPQLKDEEIKTLRSRAEHMVRGSLLLKEVAQKENIQVDEAKFRQKMAEIASRMARTQDEFTKLLKNENVRSHVEDEVITDQVFDFLISQANISEQN